jgi:thioredoxin reductase (NADPH)
MAAAPQSIIDTRRHQMFPVLESADIERVRRFGKVRFYRAGEALAEVGNVGPGLAIILTGRVDITQHDESGCRRHIVTHEPGSSWASWRSSRADLLSSMHTRKRRSKP